MNYLIWRHFKKNKSRHRNCAINDYFPLWDFGKKNLINSIIHLRTSLIQVAGPHSTRFLSFMKSRLKWSLCKVHFTLIFFLCKVWTLIIKRLHFWELCKVKPCKVRLSVVYYPIIRLNDSLMIVQFQSATL